jgi:hypothetical protein
MEALMPLIAACFKLSGIPKGLIFVEKSSRYAFE